MPALLQPNQIEKVKTLRRNLIQAMREKAEDIDGQIQNAFTLSDEELELFHEENLLLTALELDLESVAIKLLAFEKRISIIFEKTPYENKTILEFAVEKNAYKFIEELIKIAGKNFVNFFNSENNKNNYLNYIIATKNLDLIKTVFNALRLIDGEDLFFKRINQLYLNDYSVLHQALSTQDPAIIAFVINSGADWRICNSEGIIAFTLFQKFNFNFRIQTLKLLTSEQFNLYLDIYRELLPVGPEYRKICAAISLKALATAHLRFNPKVTSYNSQIEIPMSVSETIPEFIDRIHQLKQSLGLEIENGEEEIPDYLVVFKDLSVVLTLLREIKDYLQALKTVSHPKDTQRNQNCVNKLTEAMACILVPTLAAWIGVTLFTESEENLALNVSLIGIIFSGLGMTAIINSCLPNFTLTQETPVNTTEIRELAEKVEKQLIKPAQEQKSIIQQDLEELLESLCKLQKPLISCGRFFWEKPLAYQPNTIASERLQKLIALIEKLILNIVENAKPLVLPGQKPEKNGVWTNNDNPDGEIKIDIGANYLNQDCVKLSL